MNKETVFEEIRLSLRRLKLTPTGGQAELARAEFNASIDSLLGIPSLQRPSFIHRLWAWIKAFRDIF